MKQPRSTPRFASGPPPRAGEELSLIDPERALAIAYAPVAAQRALAALFALDERLGAIVAATTEPTIGLIRLAWWREALERLDRAHPPAEPLLAALYAEALPRGATGALLAEIEDGWAALLDGETDAAAIARHGRARGGPLFAAAAAILGADDPRIPVAGEGWALADLGHRHSAPAVRAEARSQARAIFAALPANRWARPARPLAGLAMLARADARVEVRRQGSPARIAHMLAMRLFGR